MRTLSAFSVLLLVAACQTAPPPEITEAEIAQVEAAVTATAQSLFDGWNQLDASQAAGAFSSDASWSGSSTPRGPDVFRDSWAETFETLESMDFRVTPTRIRVLTRDAAVFQGTYEGSMVYENGQIWHWPGNATILLLVEQIAGEWKITLGAQAVGTAEVTNPTEG